jgi:uroporphyrinogen-III synthase
MRPQEVPRDDRRESRGASPGEAAGAAIDELIRGFLDVIPKVLPPFTDLTVLVTRPASQAASLCEQIVARGGAAIAFPAIEIEPLPAPEAAEHDLVVFVSVNAVAHGARLIRKGPATRIAAIGRATAAALAQAQLPADIVPEAGFDSEALLAHPDLELRAGARVLIVRGSGGRELLQETFLAHGLSVETREVYRRVRPTIDEQRRAAVEAQWTEEGIDVVTLTSIETLHNLLALLSESGRERLRTTALLLASRRILQAAREAGLHGDEIVAAGADDASMLGALAQWRTRARTPRTERPR